jgi:gamma-glutamyltranspeptidase/glutathione hydrolase
MALACAIVWTASISATSAQQVDASNSSASGTNGAVATGSQLAADAGLKMLQDGGNAIDAAVATMLVQTVTENRLFCFGSEAPIIVYNAERGVVEVVAALGAAPRLATVEWFQQNRDGAIAGRGDIANCVVPGLLDGLLTALDRYGTRSFSQCSQAMVAELHRRREMSAEQVRQSFRLPESVDPSDWIRRHQNFARMIDRLVEAEKAGGGDHRSGLRAVADYFYRGPMAREIDDWSRTNGGLLRYADFATHHTRIDSPLCVEFKGHTICKCGVWTQGPFMLQTLRLLENQDLAAMDPNSAQYIHLLAEAMKLAFADRDTYFGDPEFVDVPIEALLSHDYTVRRRALIDQDNASLELRPGDPVGGKALLGISPQDHQVTSGHSSDTSNCLVADRWGNVVAATPSGWGGVIAGETGVELGSRMIGLTTWPDHPSMLEPGKRPRITLTPTLVLKDGKPVFAISVAGGDLQDQASLQIFLNRFVFDFDPPRAVQTSRFSTAHHINWFGHLPAQPGSLTVPRGTSAAVRDALRDKGHQVEIGRTAGGAAVLAIDPTSGQKHAATDRGRAARAY